jgi:hypothetical protein
MEDARIKVAIINTPLKRISVAYKGYVRRIIVQIYIPNKSGVKLSRNMAHVKITSAVINI